jgi:hypothetical protein
MRKSSLFSLILTIVAGGAIYTAFASFSEHREYTPRSLDYYLLTPVELTSLSKLCMDQPAFIYSSADGPKPGIVTMSCEIDKEAIDRHLKTSGFQPIGGHYKKEDVEVQIEANPFEEKITSIALIEPIYY